MHYGRMICIGWDVSYKFGRYLYIFIAILIYCDIMCILKVCKVSMSLWGANQGYSLKENIRVFELPCFGMNQ